MYAKKAAGATRAVTFEDAMEGGSDSGAPVADALGLQLKRASRLDYLDRTGHPAMAGHERKLFAELVSIDYAPSLDDALFQASLPADARR